MNTQQKRAKLLEKFGLTAESEGMVSVVDKVAQIAPTDITVLLQGESGVGKDVVARAIHGLSKRSEGNLVIVNCGAIPEGIIESELFGHEKGSFTGAHEAREGYFEKADGGTIFLDEIGDTPKNVQVKLLRILENGEFFRVGSSKVKKSVVRIIAATNRDLWKDVQNGTFREDLFYRLNTVMIRIPPLRERPEDIIPIFRKFVLDFSREYDSVFHGFTDEARELLVSYRWPGNIRELRNVAEQLVVLEKSQFITPEILQKYLKGRQSLGSPDNLPVLLRDAGQAGYFDDRFSAPPLSGDERAALYRSMLEMRTELADIKRMLARYIYTQMGGLPGKTPLIPENISQHRDLFNPAAGVSPDLGSDSHEVAHWPDLSENDVDYTPVNPHESVHTSYGGSGMPHINPARSGRQASGVDTDDEIATGVASGINPLDSLSAGEFPSLEEAERYLIEKALKKYDGNRRKASEVLGISERTLYRKIDQYDLD